MIIFRYETRKFIRSFIERVLTNRIGWFLAVAHLCLTVYDFVQKGAHYSNTNDCVFAREWNFTGYLIAGRFFHFTYESTIHKVTLLLDLPSLIVSGLVMLPISYFSPADVCAVTESWIHAYVLLVVTSLQWLIVGYIIQSIFFKSNESKMIKEQK